VERMLYGAAVLLLLLLPVALVASCNAHNEWVAACEAQGGHVISDTDTNVGVGWAPGANGGSGGVVTTVTSSTDYFCLDAEGRVLGIR
jgi:hypothetical protein